MKNKVSTLGTKPSSALMMAMLMYGFVGCSSAENSSAGRVGLAGNNKKEQLVRDPRSAETSATKVEMRNAETSTPAPSRDLSLAKVPTEQEASDLIRADFAANGGSSDIIYVDIRHLAQQSTGTKELQAYRFGIAKTLNSISVAPTIIKLNAVDDAETIFRVKLSDYTLSTGWSAILGDKRAKDNVTKADGTTIVKGDWLVFAATRPEVYNNVMRIPGTVSGLEAEFKPDYNQAVYVNAPASTVTFFGRILQRNPINVGGKPGGYYWRTYDPVGKPLESQGFNNPESLRFATVPVLWAGEYFFSLPNGLQGYALSGFILQSRLDAQLFAATDPRRPQDGLTTCTGGAKNCGYVLNGESCMTCHASGINQPSKILGFKGVANEKDAADLFAQDRERFVTALNELGYSDYQGPEPILETITAFKKRTNNVDKRVQAGNVEAFNFNGGIFTRK